jgi:hypothetical protein
MKKKLVTLTLALVVGLVAVTAASAHSTPHQIKVLKHRLHNMTASRDQARAQLVASQAQVATLTSQGASLAAALAQRTSERNVALSERDVSLRHAAALQAQLDSILTPLAIGERQVQEQVSYSEGVLSGAGVPYSHGQLVSQAAMDYVVGHVNAPAYGFDVSVGQKPTATPDGILGSQAGLCGSAALTFAAIVKHFGFPVRSVQFYYGPDGQWNHISDEVSYDGSWHYFDPTFGIFYRQGADVLSIGDARAASDPTALLVKDNSLFWTNVTEQAGITELSDTSFATDPATSVVLDGQPFVG